jgi:hypothetical protein
LILDFSLYFGDSTSEPTKNPFSIEHSHSLEAAPLNLLKQIHSSDVLISSETSELFVRQGDALITNRPGQAIGVLTADCLPIIFFDKIAMAIGVAHAGWRGSIAGIATKTVKAMGVNFGSKPEDIKVFFGPAAGPCCYEVSRDFEQNYFAQSLGRYKNETFLARDKKYFFDNTKFNYLQLTQAGVKDISFDHNVCTICDHRYHSYRRSGNSAGRQLSAAIISKH